MEQEHKKLLLKDLCSRLPYGVKIVIQDTFKYSIVPREYHVLGVSNFSDIFCFNYKKFGKSMKKAMRERPNDIVIKPYLFPMSSMTEEQKEELDNMFNQKDDICEKIETDNFEFCFIENQFFDFLNKYRLDYRGLIPKGLAIDATGLNIY